MPSILERKERKSLFHFHFNSVVHLDVMFEYFIIFVMAFVYYPEVRTQCLFGVLLRTSELVSVQSNMTRASFFFRLVNTLHLISDSLMGKAVLLRIYLFCMFNLKPHLIRTKCMQGNLYTFVVCRLILYVINATVILFVTLKRFI